MSAIDNKHGTDFTAAGLPQMSEASKKQISGLLNDATSKVVTSIGTAIAKAAGVPSHLSLGSKIKVGTIPSPLKQKSMGNHSVLFSKIVGMNTTYNKLLSAVLIKMNEDPLIDIAIEWIQERAKENDVRAFVQSHVMPKATELCTKVTTADKQNFADETFWKPDLTKDKVAKLFAICKIDIQK